MAISRNQELFHKGTNQLIYGTLTREKQFFYTDRKNWWALAAPEDQLLYVDVSMHGGQRSRQPNLLLRSQTLVFETGSQWTRSSPIWLAWPNADQNRLGEERKGLGLQCSNHHPSLKVRTSRKELKQRSWRRNTAYWTSCYLLPVFPRQGVSV